MATNNAINTINLAALATVSLVGNPTGSPAAVSAITLTQGLAFSGSTMTVGQANNIIFNNGQGIQDSNSNSLISFTTVASAVNSFNLSNNTTTNAPTLSVVGSDSNVNMVLASKGTGFIGLYSQTGNVPMFIVESVTSGVDYLEVIGAATANPATVQFVAAGTDSNINIAIGPKGTGLVKLASASSFSANAAVATLLGSLGPTGSHTTVQTWLTILDNGGSTRYIPCF